MFPRRPSYRVYISQLIRFASVCNHVTDSNAQNKSSQPNFYSKDIDINCERPSQNFIANSMNFINSMSV